MLVALLQAYAGEVNDSEDSPGDAHRVYNGNLLPNSRMGPWILSISGGGECLDDR
jgi:hypothetical protein